MMAHYCESSPEGATETPGIRRPGAKNCYRPIDHRGDCGEPANDVEEEQRILYGRCGASWPPLMGVLHARTRSMR
jgi:hypothetical protein